ncbi:MAG TPA: hypothetical protein VFK38_05565 [Candidatus Limnocylindrales bacterium]|nr:hypothetical protein [Candidatus Limnocylindrales bacterium]
MPRRLRAIIAAPLLLAMAAAPAEARAPLMRDSPADALSTAESRTGDTAGTTPTTTTSSATTATAIVPGSVGRTSLRLEVRYTAALTLRWGYASISTAATLAVRNTSGGPIDRLELNTVAARLGRMRLRYVTVDGRAVTATVTGQTIVVPLGGILPDGASTRVRVGYTAFLRSGTSGSDWMFTKARGIVDLYRWLPWVSRVRRFERPNFGDPFVTPVSPRVEVTVTTDRPLRIATGGRRTHVSGLSQRFVAENVRDFNLTAAPDYRAATAWSGDTLVRVFYRPGAPASAMLSWAARALARMEALLGPYPYPTYTVAQSAGGHGMESPALTWIPSGVAASQLPFLVSHETAHQWFYALVGNDQASEPFADEAMADFLARYVTGTLRGSRCATDRLDRTIYAYSSGCYYEVIYIQGGNYLNAVRKRMGSSAFWRATRAYLAENRWSLGGTKRLLDELDEHTSLGLASTYALRFPRYY